MLGCGSYGAVVRARWNGQDYAIKGFWDRGEEAEATRARFLTEAAILGSINHPCVPKRVEDFERDGCYYLVQTCVPGKPLSAQVAAGVRFSEQQVMAVLDQLLGILQVLHQGDQGDGPGIEPEKWPIVHRDLRLSNLFWSEGQVYLIDFGLARRIGCPGDLALPDSVEPGDGDEADGVEGSSDRRYRNQRRSQAPQSDLFGAGIVAVDMMTNHAPLDGLNEQRWDAVVPFSSAMITFVQRLLGESEVGQMRSAAAARAELRSIME